jgi:uncharacterized protein YxjI
MRFLLQQKLFAFGDDFYIRDEHGNDVYFVDGKMFSLGDQLSFQDLNGNELASIRQKLLSWGPTYHVYVAGELRAEVKKELFTLFSCRFSVDVPGPNDYEAKGDFLEHEYTFTRGDREVAAVSKEWLTIRDTYAIDVGPGEDEVLILASAIVIDMACHPTRDR